MVLPSRLHPTRPPWDLCWGLKTLGFPGPPYAWHPPNLKASPCSPGSPAQGRAQAMVLECVTKESRSNLLVFLETQKTVFTL